MTTASPNNLTRVAITAIGLSSNVFASGSPANTIVATITVTTSDNSSVTDALTLGGADAGSFHIEDNSLATSAVLMARVYHFTISAGSFSQDFFLTGAPHGLVAVPLGAYISTWLGDAGSEQPGATWKSHWNRFVAALGRTPTILGVGLNNSVSGQDNSPRSWGASARYNVNAMFDMTGQGPDTIIPSIAWPFGYDNSSVGGYVGDIFAGMAAGFHDANIREVLATYKAAGYRKLYLRPAWEFNIGFARAVVTARNVTVFVAALQNFYTVCKKYAAANGMNIRVIWNLSCPNANGALPLAQQYPGPPNYPAYDGCDSIGCDVYAEGRTKVSTVSSSTTKAYVTTLIDLAIARGKTICFPEAGGCSTNSALTPSGLASDWVTDCVTYLSQIATSVPIEYVLLWDVAYRDWKHNTEFTYATQYPDNPAIIAAWKAGLGPDGSLRSLPVPD